MHVHTGSHWSWLIRLPVRLAEAKWQLQGSISKGRLGVCLHHLRYSDNYNYMSKIIYVLDYTEYSEALTYTYSHEAAYIQDIVQRIKILEGTKVTNNLLDLYLPPERATVLPGSLRVAISGAKLMMRVRASLQLEQVVQTRSIPTYT